MDQRFPFSVFPNGWYCVAFSDELKAGGVTSRTFCGEEVAVFRTESGQVAVMDAYCPHLGAHLGKGGTVNGEQIHCPFHDFRFDCSGTCTGTGYGTKPPPRARLRPREVCEKNGLILVWFDPAGEEPTWQIPDLEMDGWTHLRHGMWPVRTHPQETTENSVDLGHFATVHKYTDVEQTEPLFTEGPYLRSKYSFNRSAEGLPGGKRGKIRVEFTAEVHGLGYSVVHAEARALKVKTRIFVLPMPRDGDIVELRAAAAVRKDFQLGKYHWLLSILPRSLLVPLVHRQTFMAYRNDVQQDFKIWENKIYAHPPLLAKGDGPIAAYRKWAQQFYREDTLHQVRELPA
ncbi:MAG: phenylpropionate dioxygenase-like ring-hydroxylating dioxygenase large terminal subunit [Myxococcota bacterium]|jgi:phenylpropionate dioxygenase-like ring-hydroxylating dioxygenase large terminal subunit